MNCDTLMLVRKVKKNLLTFGLCILMLCGCSRISTKPAVKSFNILTGAHKEELANLHGHYDLLIINADHLNKQDIKDLRQHTKKVYAYLDIAAITPLSKSFKTYQKDVVKPTVSKRKYYINPAKKKWQKHVINQAQSLKKKGIDGYLLDHTDLYTKDGNQKIYQGLKTIVSGIKKENKPILLNNAMNFIERDNTVMKQIQGVVQEDVFTYWNHQTNRREDVAKTPSNNLKIYLNNIKAMNKAVYVVDFTKKSDWQAVITAVAKKNGWVYLAGKDTGYSVE